MEHGNMFFMHCLLWLHVIQEQRSLLIDLDDESIEMSCLNRSARMNPLIATNEEDKAIIQKGDCRFYFKKKIIKTNIRFRLLVNRQRRLTEQDKSLFKIPPSAAESSIVHDLFLKTISAEYVLFI